MADVYAVFGTLLALGIVFPGLVTTPWLLFPATVERARARVERAPWRCFWTGVLTALVLFIPIAILLNLPFGGGRLIGFLLIFLALATSSIGAAGLAAKMGSRLAELSYGRISPAGAFIRGAIALELAAAFPVVGWFVVLPAALFTALGATTLALLRRRPLVAAAAQGDAALSQV
jgi:hypothetical protein